MTTKKVWQTSTNQLFRKPRYFVAQLLNKYTDACWCRLVLWAEFGGLNLPEISYRCKPGGDDNSPPYSELMSGCYCGKFSTHHRRTGMVGEDD